jgi:FeS assembly SUF system regulator
MMRITRLTDYATVILGVLAAEPERMHTAAALAARTRIGAPTASKLLKELHHARLVSSSRGLHGGYQLARPASAISAADILDALEGGPVALTDCAVAHGQCGIEATCCVGRGWQKLNVAIRRALADVSLAQHAGLDPVPLTLGPRALKASELERS